jgi:hypothetical protein
MGAGKDLATGLGGLVAGFITEDLLNARDIIFCVVDAAAVMFIAWVIGGLIGF